MAYRDEIRAKRRKWKWMNRAPRRRALPEVVIHSPRYSPVPVSWWDRVKARWGRR